MRHLLAGLAAGILFGAGLALAGMTDPAIVLGFLDVTGAWNPALAAVMAAALAVTFLGYRLVWRRGRPLLAERFHLPTARAIERDQPVAPVPVATMRPDDEWRSSRAPSARR